MKSSLTPSVFTQGIRYILTKHLSAFDRGLIAAIKCTINIQFSSVNLVNGLNQCHIIDIKEKSQ